MYSKVICLFCILLLFQPSFAQQKKYTIVIDPGHGGKDPGKPKGNNHTQHEKDIVLAIAIKLGEMINEDLKQVKVLYTRTKDIFVSLEDRVSLANDNKADIFISIHANSNAQRSIHGTETHIYSHQLKASKQLALLIEKEFKTKANRKSKGILDAEERGKNLYVTQYTEMPSVLIETGYLSNPEEERFLNSEQGQIAIASAIFRALKTYLSIKRPAENRSKVYKVQIKASSTPIDIDSSVFEDLDEKVVEFISSKDEKYKYKYFIGREYDPQRAEKLAKKVAKLGYPGAFVVEVE